VSDNVEKGFEADIYIYVYIYLYILRLFQFLSLSGLSIDAFLNMIYM